MPQATRIASATLPDLADEISGAERRLAMLQRLGSLGMHVAEEIAQRMVNSPYHPEPRHEPARAFAAISRAVRLTIVLEARVEAELFALRRGEVPVAPPVATTRPRTVARTSDDDDDADDHDGDGGEESLARERTWESLVDREDDDALLDLPFDECVEVIRANLGLSDGARTSRPRAGSAGDVETADETSALRVAISPSERTGDAGAGGLEPAEAGWPRPPDRWPPPPRR